VGQSVPVRSSFETKEAKCFPEPTSSGLQENAKPITDTSTFPAAVATFDRHNDAETEVRKLGLAGFDNFSIGQNSHVRLAVTLWVLVLLPNKPT